MDGGNQPALRSGALAKLAGVSPDTLRLYERKGLLNRPPRSANGYRSYPPESIGRVQLIRGALSIGFTLAELSEVFAMRDRQAAPCAHVRSLASQKLHNLDRHIAELVELRQHLRGLLRRWDRTLKNLPRGKRAGLLEEIADSGVGRRLSPQIYSSLARKMVPKESQK